MALHVTFYCYAGWPVAVNAERLLTAAFGAYDVEFADLE